MKQWYYCNICGQKLLQIDPAVKISGVYIKCKRCRQEVEIKHNPEPKPEPTASAV